MMGFITATNAGRMVFHPFHQHHSFETKDVTVNQPQIVSPLIGTSETYKVDIGKLLEGAFTY